ncbi:hypothetical protein DFJ74DRAFT_523230 [Hyaloraphidium curvatum]|nr:hypothetical protein DFJ74DRAFT_523230 [Hyaloraphidium curvatum]
MTTRLPADLVAELRGACQEYRDAVRTNHEDQSDLVETRLAAAKACVVNTLEDVDRWTRTSPGEGQIVVTAIRDELLLDVHSASQTSDSLLHQIGWDIVHLLAPYTACSFESDAAVRGSASAAEDVLLAIGDQCNAREIHMIGLERLSMLPVSEIEATDWAANRGMLNEFLVVSEMTLRATRRIRRGKAFLSFAANAWSAILPLLDALAGYYASVADESVQNEYRAKSLKGAASAVVGPLDVDSVVVHALGTIEDLFKLIASLQPEVGLSDCGSYPPPTDTPQDQGAVEDRLQCRVLLFHVLLSTMGRVVSRMPLSLSGKPGILVEHSRTFASNLLSNAKPFGIDVDDLYSHSLGEANSEGDDVSPAGMVSGIAVLASIATSGPTGRPIFDGIRWALESKKEDAVGTSVELCHVLLSLGGSDATVEVADKACSLFRAIVDVQRVRPLGRQALFEDAELGPLWQMIQSACVCMTTTPSPFIRTACFRELERFAMSCLDDEARLHFIGQLLQPSPYVGVTVAGITILKKSVQVAFDNPSAHPGIFSTEVVLRVALNVLFKLDGDIYKAFGGDGTSSPAQSAGLSMQAFTERHAVVMHVLNLYLYFLLRDAENRTGVWNAHNLAAVERDFVGPLRKESERMKAETEVALAAKPAPNAEEKQTLTDRLMNLLLIEQVVSRIDELRRKREAS